MIAALPTEYQFVRLDDYETTFWRYQHHSSSCLATVESIYYFYKEWETAQKSLQTQLESSNALEKSNPWSFDDLLILYAMQWHKIKTSLKENPARSSGKHKEYFNRLAEEEKTSKSIVHSKKTKKKKESNKRVKELKSSNLETSQISQSKNKQID